MSGLLRSLLLLAWMCTAALVAADATPRITVMRIDTVFRGATIYQAAAKAMEKDEADAKTRLIDFNGKIEAAENKIKLLAPGSDEAQRVAEQIELIKVQRKQYSDSVSAALNRRYMQAIREVYKRVREQLAEYARNRNIAYVGLAQEGELNAGTVSETRLQLSLTTVLYADPALDITDDFLVYFNSKTGALVAPTTPSATAAASPAP